MYWARVQVEKTFLERLQPKRSPVSLQGREWRRWFGWLHHDRWSHRSSTVTFIEPLWHGNFVICVASSEWFEPRPMLPCFLALLLSSPYLSILLSAVTTADINSAAMTYLSTTRSVELIFGRFYCSWAGSFSSNWQRFLCLQQFCLSFCALFFLLSTW